jgi:hypothetical protein
VAGRGAPRSCRAPSWLAQVELAGDVLQPLPALACADTRGADCEAGQSFVGEGEHAPSYHGPACSRTRTARAKEDERVGWAAVVSLAPKKRLCLNVRRKRLLVSPFGKKLCDINERHNPF